MTTAAAPAMYAHSTPLDAMFGGAIRTTPANPWLHAWQAHSLAEHLHHQRRRSTVEQMKKAWLRDHMKSRSTGGGWLQEDDHAKLSLRLPDHEEGTLSARLSADGRKLELTGTTCQAQKLAEIALPYGTASVDDVELLQQEDGSVVVHAKPKKPVPLEVKIKASPRLDEVSPLNKESQGQLADATRQARDEEKEEKELDRKFKMTIDNVAKQADAVEKMKSAVSASATGEEPVAGQVESTDTTPESGPE